MLGTMLSRAHASETFSAGLFVSEELIFLARYMKFQSALKSFSGVSPLPKKRLKK